MNTKKSYLFSCFPLRWCLNKFINFRIIITLTISLTIIFIYYIFYYDQIKNLAKLNDPNKWLIYECSSKFVCGGWADRLKGIMSVYALSLMTNRHFLINITSPCNFSKLFLPNLINWSLTQSYNNFTNVVHMNCMNQRKPRPECLRKFEVKEVIEDMEKEDAPYILALTSNREWLEFFSRQKSFRSQILANGFKTNENFKIHLVFHQWYKKLFKLAPELNQKYENIKNKAQLDETIRVYCAQIRIGGSRPHVPFDARFNEIGVQKLFWKFIRSEFIEKVKKI
jgi:hypothetical protein